MIMCYGRPGWANHIGKVMDRRGNLSLRGPARNTTIGFECPICLGRISVVDDWADPTPEVLAEIDLTE